MGSSPSVLLLDDGELEDIYTLLQELGVACARVRGGAIVQGTPPPKDLLVATPRRMDAVEETLESCAEPPIRMMVVQEDSNALRERLRQNGFDYLVRRPVHNEALRLLLLHCIFKGEEKRRDQRVAVGREVQYRAGLMNRRATLIDLSARGCRLLAKNRFEPGRSLRLQIPDALDMGDPLVLRGRVMRTETLERNGSTQHAMGIEFLNVSADTSAALKTILQDRQRGPATMRNGADVLSRPQVPTADPEEANASDSAPVDGRNPYRGVVREINTVRRVEDPSPDGASNATPPPAASARPPLAAAEPEEETLASGLPEHRRFESPEFEVDFEIESEDSTDDTEDKPLSDAQAPDDGTSDIERRIHRRSHYQQTIPAFGNRALRVLVGRDLSVGGMRIGRLEGLEVGDRLHLAVYGEPGEEPLLIWGTIVRDHGSEGMGVSFDPLNDDSAAKLEHLVADLPAVESLHDTEVEAMGTVLTEIVGTTGSG